MCESDQGLLRILVFIGLFLISILGGTGGKGGLGKKSLVDIDRARLAVLGIGNG